MPESKWGVWSWCLGLPLVTAILFLFSPPPPPDAHFIGSYIYWNGWMGAVWNGDSDEYIAIAKDPSRVLTLYSARQSRPLAGIPACIIGYLLFIIDNLLGIGIDIETYIFVSYIFINWCMLAVALRLWLWLLKSNHFSIEYIVLSSCILVCNSVVKAFFWTPHQQMLTILMPIIWISTLVWLSKRKVSNVFYCFMAFIAGVSLLFYGSCILSLPVLVTAFFLNKRNEHKMYKLILISMLMICLFFISYVVWVMICSLKLGYYYNQEVIEFRQLVWIWDLRKLDYLGIIHKLSTFSRLFAQALGEGLMPVYWLWIFGCAGVGWLYTFDYEHRFSSSVATSDDNCLLRYGSRVFVIIFIFLACLGFYAARLCMYLIPGLLLVLGVIEKRIVLYSSRLVYRVYGCIIIISWLLACVLLMGPYS
jgi:hypothetical protein